MTTATLKKATEYREEAMETAVRISELVAKGSERSDSDTDLLRHDLATIEGLDRLWSLAERTEGDSDLGVVGDGPAAGTRIVSPSAYNPGDEFVRSDKYAKEWAGNSTRTDGTYQYEVRTLLTNTGSFINAPSSSGAGLLAPIGQPYIPPVTQIRPQLFMRDILPSAPTSLSVVPYIQEANYLSNIAGADWVLEAQQKAELQMAWQPARAFIEKIAGWIPATYEILQDVTLMRGLINNFLENAVNFREDRGLLTGSGSNGQPLGLLNASGLLSQAFAADIPSTVGKAIGKLENIEGTADFLVMNTLDYWGMVTTRYSTHFEGEALGNGSPFGGPPGTLWGLPVKRTNAMTAGTALVGDSRGALILDREGVTIRVGDQHLDYFTTNKVAILAEKRVGLAVFRPDFFVQVATV